MNTIQARRRVGMTLIEQLIVVAILAILSVTTLFILLDATRVERGVARQGEATTQIAVLEQAWRADVHVARTVVAGPPELSESGPAALVIEVLDPQTSAVEHRAFRTQPNGDGTVAVSRLRLAPAGDVLSRQVLAERLDAAEFGYDPATRLCTLRVDATRGFGAYRNRQQFTAMAALR